jgi:hypothetical protein
MSLPMDSAVLNLVRSICLPPISHPPIIHLSISQLCADGLLMAAEVADGARREEHRARACPGPPCAVPVLALAQCRPGGMRAR